jgi:hypothetical protein
VIYALKVLGFSYEEIGRITGDSYSTVNRHPSALPPSSGGRGRPNRRRKQ